MQISTMSIVVGGLICNASCPFCVSNLTTSNGVPEKLKTANWNNLAPSIKFAEQSGASTFLITSKGEPTLVPDDITYCLNALKDSKVPFREMQTNGIVIANQSKYDITSEWANRLRQWRELGLNNIAISIVSYDQAKNKSVYTPNGIYPDLVKTIGFLKRFGFNIRLSCILTKGNTDSIEEVIKVIDFAKENGCFQLTFIPVTTPEQLGELDNAKETEKWAKEHNVHDFVKKELVNHFALNAVKLLEMPHGATVFDYKGQNVCLSNCLTENSNPNQMRQLLYFTHDGSLRYSWQYAGARIL
jgi:MoaA/NifB/PqqE/SkfB family radical SAM enzyme